MSDPSLHVLHIDAEMGFSGGEVQVFLLMEGLRERGHRCSLIAPPGSRAEVEAGTRGFEFRGVRMSSDLDLFAVASLKRAIQELAPELVHLHTGRATWLGGQAAQLAHMPAITTRRMDRPLTRGWRTTRIYRSFVQRAVAISPAVERCLVEGGVPPALITTIPSSVDPRAFEPKFTRFRVREMHAAAADDFVLLVLAALVERKGIDILLDALALCARVGIEPRLWIAGEGEEQDQLEAQVARLGLAMHVRFLGRVPSRFERNTDSAQADSADLLAAADVFVLPARHEGLGVSALEAMAAGRAVVASRVGGLGEAIVDGVSGLLVPPEDPSALAAAIASLYKDRALRERLARGGLARVRESFDAEQMVLSYERLYREVLAEQAGA